MSRSVLQLALTLGLFGVVFATALLNLPTIALTAFLAECFVSVSGLWGVQP